ncbi:MAG TPA: hypothetical protein VL202_05150 [Pararhizobium sp.]|uniref:hypothetical protein n=1 Tax=Pararhizobium sp. TaxID=1977563 RepID=UPI002C440669|nr:hypothetical protein [Pararhizobium sp.]HTO30551.1 hypothetical protein [Pararhizobium sp.]
MTRETDRRTVLMAAGAAALAAVARPGAAQSAEINGTITFEGGSAIPEGQLEIYLEDPAAKNKARAMQTRVDSNGGVKTIAFSLTSPEASAASAPLRIVARLERADGWLLARGSARYQPGLPVTVTLKTVMY